MKYFLCFFLYVNMTNKKQKKLEKKHSNDIRIVLKKKNQKVKKSLEKISKFKRRRTKKQRQYHRDRNKNLSEEQKQKLVKYMRNYYSAQ